MAAAYMPDVYTVCDDSNVDHAEFNQNTLAEIKNEFFFNIM